jgi:A/G-specific adenine glycosylase
MSDKITKALLHWFLKNKRDLPWRKTKDPYFIWLSEIIFQQTRISQGMDYYLRFAEKHPDIFSLAKAPEDDVLKLWQGLGYYSRARNMLKTARQIVEVYNGKFPSDYKNLVQLKGIGDYTASVILSVCFDKPYPVIDGNVNRLISRLYNISEFIDVPSGQKRIRDHVTSLINHQFPGDFNEAMMDFGSLVCTPQKPDCNKCVLQKLCIGFKEGKVELLPQKSPKRVSKKRIFHYFLVRTDSGILIKQRTAKDIWHNLYDLPLIELSPGMNISKEQIQSYFKSVIKSFKLIHEVKHKLTHQDLCLHFYETFLDQIPDGYLDISKENLNKYAFPKPIDYFLQNFK